MMAKNEEDITRGHELYLKHLLLLGQAAPVALRAVIEREVKASGNDLATLLAGNKDIFNKSYKAEFHCLFQEEKVNTNIDSWDTYLLCVVALVLFESQLACIELAAIQCVSLQLGDLNNYAQSASLNFTTFESKWKMLHSAVLDLITYIDDEARFESTRMMHSFAPESESISVNLELINQMKQTNDASLHVQMAIHDKVVPKIHREHDDSLDENKDKIPLHYDNPIFTERLQDICIYVDDSVILTCNLNVSENAVTWRHDYKPLEETNTLKFLTDKYTHWLAISRVKLTDKGHYTCECGNTSTSASLDVLEKRLEITKELYVATKEADVRENMDITLSCTVNLVTNKAVWLHNNKEIKHCTRRVVSVQEHEHKLTIRNAKFEDEGEYIVNFDAARSCTKLEIKGNLNLLHRKQLADDLYRNWIRGALGLKYLKIALEGFSDMTVRHHHSELLARLSSIGTICTCCTAEQLLPSHKQDNCPKKTNCLCSKQPHKRKPCPNGGFCSRFFDYVFFDHRFFSPLLTNTDIQTWSTDPWSVTTCYINTTGYKGKTSAKDVDCAGLLSLFINNAFFERSLGNVEINGETDVFKQARDARNDILHSANYELTEGELNHYIDVFRGALEIKNINGGTPLSGQPGVQQALANLNELQKHQIDIHTSEDLRKEKQNIQEHAMGDLARKLNEAESQYQIKHQQLEEQLKEKEEELQFMRGLRSAQTKNAASTKDPFELKLHIRCVAFSGETMTEGCKRLYKSMKEYVASPTDKPDQPIKSTDQSVRRLLSNITNLKDCEIVDVFDIEPSPFIKIHCFTCKAIEEVLKIINGNEFQKETVEIRKSLENEDHIKTDDVIVNCSSESIDNTKKRLYNRVQSVDFSCGEHQGTQCTWYCSDHDRFCCSACKDSEHSACVGIKQVVSERSYGIQKQSLTFMRKIGKYNVRIKNRLLNRKENDENDCAVTNICMLPDGNILLIDYGNVRLKKLDSSYKVVGHCDIPYMPDIPYIPDVLNGVCYIGDDRAVVCLSRGDIQFVNVSGSLKFEQVAKLDHSCYALACHGDKLYVSGGDTIYTYNRDCKQKHILYKCKDLETYHNFNGIAVSDDGERIYITCSATGLITIDKRGNQLFSLTFDKKINCLDVFNVGDGTVLALDRSGCVYQVDYSGKQVLGIVADLSAALDTHLSLCYDRQKCRIIVTNVNVRSITVFELKYH